MPLPLSQFFSSSHARILLLALGIGISPLQAQQMNYNSPLHARAVKHEDGTYSHSIKDVRKREMIDSTYDARKVLITKKRFLLNERGDPIQGVIYDGANNLMANVQFYFDNLGRVIEERLINTQGQIFRRVIRQYDASGKALEPRAFDYAVNTPKAKVSPVDFTNSGTAANPNAPTAAPQGIQARPPAPARATSSTAPATSAAPAAPAPEKKKRRWFGKD